MENKTNIFKRFHAAIKTQHVFIEDEQVFLKRNTNKIIVDDASADEWHPTEFQWIPVEH